MGDDLSSTGGFLEDSAPGDMGIYGDGDGDTQYGYDSTYATTDVDTADDIVCE